MINLEIKFSVFEVPQLLLFIFLKDRSIVREQENIVKTFVSYVHTEVIRRDILLS